MQFNDTSTYLGICQEIDDLCSTDTTSYPVSAKVRRSNTALETLAGYAILSDGTWQFDDRNFTTLPEGTVNLSNGVASYSFSDKFLSIREVLVLDTTGVYRKVQPIDPSILGTQSWEEYFGTQSGLPLYYDKVEDTIKLAPVPSTSTTTLTAGLKVRFQRTASLFTASDTTKEPGIASQFHYLIPLMAALPYNKTYHPERVPQMERDIASGIVQFQRYYGKREKDVRQRVTTKPISFR